MITTSQSAFAPPLRSWRLKRSMSANAHSVTRLDGIGVDTWGVDFGLIGRDGSLVANPMHYRDARNDGMIEKTIAAVPREEMFAQTGVQFMQLNTVPASP